jgi:hypothetical protein
MQAAKAANFDTSHLANLTRAAAIDTSAAYKSVPGATDQVIEACGLAVKMAYTQSYKIVYLAALGFGGLGIICALFSRDTDRATKTGPKAV